MGAKTLAWLCSPPAVSTGDALRMWDIHIRLKGADPQETTDVWQAAGSLPWDISNSTWDLCLDNWILPQILFLIPLKCMS